MNIHNLVLFLNSLGHALLLAFLLAFSHGLLKWVAIQKVDGYINILITHWFIITSAISIYVFIFFYYIYVLRGVSIAILYPTYTGLSIIFVLLIGISFFGESVNYLQIIGCLLIIGGVLLVSVN